MALRDWSFTRLWAVTAGIWLAAAGAGEIADYFGRFGIVVLGIAFLPAFLAGAWAGEHSEIAHWPRARLFSMWALTLCAFLGATDYVDHWRLAASVVAAPVAILTLRWYELTAGAEPRHEIPTAVPTEASIPPVSTDTKPTSG
jgi:hypothetical protein